MLIEIRTSCSGACESCGLVVSGKVSPLLSMDAVFLVASGTCFRFFAKFFRNSM